ncbi:MAG: D-2-hydroxyacid dehydrogenase [Lachnospiraceae bacterium]|nr:D-2-hydroxyacid dehydrogenase [Lachnospiraceae bacterium]
MKIVFLETGTLGKDVSIDKFHSLGEVIEYDLTLEEQIPERITDADVIVVNKLPMNKKTLDKARNLKLICLTATGTNNIDFPYTDSRNITVKNVASYSTESVVQHTFALLFYLYEKLPYYDNYVKSEEYAYAPFFCHIEERFHELFGKTWGIIGLGEIGHRVAEVARCFGCKIIYYSTSGKNVDPFYERVSLDRLLEESDIISIHAPLNDNTLNLVNKDCFDKMKKTAYLLNLGRGPIVNENDLYEALVNDKIAGAATDVLCKEPMSKDNPLIKIKDSKKLFITPHIAWATIEARQRCADRVFDNVKNFMRNL